MKRFFTGTALLLSLIASSCTHGMLDSGTRKELQELRARKLLIRALKSYDLDPACIKTIFIKDLPYDSDCRKSILYLNKRFFDPAFSMELEPHMYQIAYSLSTHNYDENTVEGVLTGIVSIIEHLLRDRRYETVIMMMAEALNRRYQIMQTLSEPGQKKRFDICENICVAMLVYLLTNRYTVELANDDEQLKIAAEACAKKGDRINFMPRTVIYLGKDKKRIAFHLSPCEPTQLTGELFQTGSLDASSTSRSSSLSSSSSTVRTNHTGITTVPSITSAHLIRETCMPTASTSSATALSAAISK